MAHELKNKKIVIAGANGLLGRTLWENLIENSRELVLIDLAEEPVFPLNGSKYHKADVTSFKSIQNALDQEPDIDAFVNLSYPRTPGYGRDLLEVTTEDFNENIGSQIGSNFSFMKYFARKFIRDCRPISLVNIGSIYGVVAPKFDIYADTNFTMPVEYAASKSALVHLSQYFVKYVNAADFRINCVSPGGIFDGHDDSFVKNYGKHTTSGKMLDPKDVVGAIEFLMTDASRCINGQNIVVDDGFCL